METFEVDTEFAEFNPDDLPEKWQVYPLLKRTQLMGNLFFKQNDFLLLKVPSASVNGDFNYVANPFHLAVKDIKLLEKVKFSFDDRLL